MPTYWYRCQACKYEFEEFQKISDPPVKICPECDGVVMRVITGGAGLIFKGSGFYITDYRSDSYKKAETAEKSNLGSTSSSKKKPKPTSTTKTSKTKDP